MRELIKANQETAVQIKTEKKTASKLKRNIDYIKKNYVLYLLIAPAVILTIIFKYVPIYGATIAFKDFNPLKGIVGSDWVGLKHFENFLSSPNFLQIFMNTLKLSSFELLIGFPIPIILALMLNQVRRAKFKKNIQLVLYAPHFISIVVVSGMVFLFLSPAGPINALLSIFLDKPVSFMSDPDAFRTIYIVSGVWQGAGWASIIYVAALANVDPQLHDAATIDGASLLQRIRHIDLPTLKPVMAVLFILAAGGIMAIGFEKAYLLQTSMNITTSEIIPTYVYKRGLLAGDYSFATAVGLFNAVINVFLLVFVNQVVKKLNEGEGLL
ncbi:ABC transporter permease [Anaerobacillus alkalidiazotrophicus]|uniref:ABC transporter permease n=1 Tax=Anaerobacillus alkalidiazotrophicus TaxID=472963 RepID=A0A1S2MAI4_9BACI|nr:ABC transporter permease subunit [Anaerobacillus alkalidiazotrophicus]OIJ21566.1 ABC transporter permease [Anaerobacillus alkalidiazotrophicus]